MKKDKEWLRNEVNELPLRFLGFSMLKQREEFAVNKDDVLELINQLDEPEVLSQEEVDQAYKDGYEKGKEYASGKEAEETETVASVFLDYLIASAKLKLTLGMEVKELEE